MPASTILKLARRNDALIHGIEAIKKETASLRNRKRTNKKHVASIKILLEDIILQLTSIYKKSGKWRKNHNATIHHVSDTMKRMQILIEELDEDSSQISEDILRNNERHKKLWDRFIINDTILQVEEMKAIDQAGSI